MLHQRQKDRIVELLQEAVKLTRKQNSPFLLWKRLVEQAKYFPATLSPILTQGIFLIMSLQEHMSQEQEEVLGSTHLRINKLHLATLTAARHAVHDRKNDQKDWNALINGRIGTLQEEDLRWCILCVVVQMATLHPETDQTVREVFRTTHRPRAAGDRKEVEPLLDYLLMSGGRENLYELLDKHQRVDHTRRAG